MLLGSHILQLLYFPQMVGKRVMSLTSAVYVHLCSFKRWLPSEKSTIFSVLILQLLVRQSYYAATSFMDAQLGKVLNYLDEIGLRNSTIISFIGDHGK